MDILAVIKKLNTLKMQHKLTDYDSKKLVRPPTLREWAAAKGREDRRLCRLSYSKKIAIIEAMADDLELPGERRTKLKH